MKKSAKIFYGVLIFLFSLSILYYTGNMFSHIILMDKGFVFDGILSELYWQEHSLGFMFWAIIFLFIVGLCIIIFYHKHISKWTISIVIIGLFLPIVYMGIWLNNISNGLARSPSPILWFIIFAVYLLISVGLMIKDIRKIGNN